VNAPLTLCADTATEVASVALVRGGEALALRARDNPRGHGPGFLDDVEATLAKAGVALGDVEAFAVGLGPGSFTGVRIALATLKGLALACDRPLYAARTTALLRAHGEDHAERPAGAPVWAVVDARRGELYVEGPLGVVDLCAPKVFIERLLAAHGPDPLLLLGSGATLCADALRAALPGAIIPNDPRDHRPRAALLVHPALGLFDRPPPALGTLEPIYVRPSDAELNHPHGVPDAAGRLPADRPPI
jgi:tRNA threonylcarbamoyladenosine biosynthesis protein TsaB